MSTALIRQFEEPPPASPVDDASYNECLRTYYALLESWVTDTQHRRPELIQDPRVYKIKQFQTWIKASVECGCLADGFMSLKGAKASAHPSTSSDKIEIEPAPHRSRAVLQAEGERESDSEIEIDAEELAARAQRRNAQRRLTVSFSRACGAGPNSPAPFPTPADPDYLWAQRASEWEWKPETNDSPNEHLKNPPRITLTPPPESDDPLTHAQAWTPLQNGVQDGRGMLSVPGCFVLNNTRAHVECPACTETTVSVYSSACLDEYGEYAEDLHALCFEEQAMRGFHARMWEHSVGGCLCDEWRVYDAKNGISRDKVVPPQEEDSEEEVDEVVTPEVPAALLPTASDEGCSLLQTSPGPRWMDLDDDDDELPDLGEWT